MYRNSDEYRSAVRQAGARVYHRLSSQQKQELVNMLNASLGQAASSSSSVESGPSPSLLWPTSSSKSWREQVEDATMSIIKKKNEAQEPIDANGIVEEVMPLAHAAIPPSVRQQLFAKLFDMTNHTAAK